MIITLPVPLGHVALGTAICLLALGLMEHDGVVIGVELVAAALALVIVTVASAGAVNAVHHCSSADRLRSLKTRGERRMDEFLGQVEQ